MKKLFKKSLPLLMASLMFMSSVVPTFATVNENQTITTPSTGITEVFYNQESTFEITIPKLIDLGSDKETNYTVTITGDISSDETILVVPDESFLMKDTNTLSPKDDVTATVTQDKTEWKFNEFETIGNGNVSAPNLSAGIWQGTFYFNLSLEKIVTSEAGLYDANGVMLCTWEESGIDVEKDYDNYSNSDNYYEKNSSSGYYVLKNNYPTTTKIVLPKETTKIGDYTFFKCTKLNEIIIPNNVNSIGQSSFGWTNLTSVNIPDNVTIIEDFAFTVCSKLTNVILSKNLETIGESAFNSCEKLESITLPQNLKNINSYAFRFTNISELNIPASVTSIGKNLFWGCNNMKKINIDINNPIYDSRNNCNAIMETSTNTLIAGIPTTIIPEDTLIIDKYSFAAIDMEELLIPESVIAINESTIVDVGIKQLNIPASVTNIELIAITGTIENINVDKNNPIYDSRNNCNAIVKTLTNEIVIGSSNTIFDETITAIGPHAFVHNHNIGSLIIPYNIKSIGMEAFRFSSVCEIRMEAVETIGEAAFANSSVFLVELPYTLKEMGHYTFVQSELFIVTYQGMTFESVNDLVGCLNANNININIEDFYETPIFELTMMQ